jgi:hypothetical protein
MNVSQIKNRFRIMHMILRLFLKLDPVEKRYMIDRLTGEFKKTGAREEGR